MHRKHNSFRYTWATKYILAYQTNLNSPLLSCLSNWSNRRHFTHCPIAACIMTLTRFLKSAVNSFVNTENFRNALPKSGSSLQTQLPPNFSRAWVYCSSFSTWATIAMWDTLLTYQPHHPTRVFLAVNKVKHTRIKIWEKSSCTRNRKNSAVPTASHCASNRSQRTSTSPRRERASHESWSLQLIGWACQGYPDTFHISQAYKMAGVTSQVNRLSPLLEIQ